MSALEKYKISFLILHYQTLKDTIECIESILKNISYVNYNIIVVDNGSTNGSGIKLREQYSENPKIKILINNENLGFARGNNIGFKYIKRKEKSDFIVMINNDTVITQNNFLTKIVDIYEEEKFHILGPKIISLVDNQNQNPQKVLYNKRSDVIKGIRRTKTLYILNLLFLENFVSFVCKHSLKKIKKILKNSSFKNSNEEDSLDNDLYKLHGSCLIFSKDYIEKYDGLYEKTFMYGEEDILYFIAKRDNLVMKYSPDIVIYHKEDSTTNYIFNKDYLKRRFIYKNRIKSLTELLKLMEESKK